MSLVDVGITCPASIAMVGRGLHLIQGGAAQRYYRDSAKHSCSNCSHAIESHPTPTSLNAVSPEAMNGRNHTSKCTQGLETTEGRHQSQVRLLRVTA